MQKLSSKIKWMLCLTNYEISYIVSCSDMFVPHRGQVKTWKYRLSTFFYSENHTAILFLHWKSIQNDLFDLTIHCVTLK